MTEIETRLFPKVGCGLGNLMPIFIYLYNNYSKEDVVKCLNYLVANNIIGIKVIHTLASDFNGNLDDMIKWTLKSNSERRFKL